MAVVPENRRIFGAMSVQENLQMGAYLRRDHDGIREDFERMMTLFPRLKERLHQPRRHAQRRRTANAGDGAGADVAPQAAADGRAVDGACAAAGRAEFRDHPAD